MVLEIRTTLGCNLTFNRVEYGRWIEMCLTNMLLPSSGADVCLSDQVVNRLGFWVCGKECNHSYSQLELSLVQHNGNGERAI